MEQSRPGVVRAADAMAAPGPPTAGMDRRQLPLPNPDVQAVAPMVDGGLMATVDYHQFINRHLPLTDRGCTSKALFISRREAQGLARNGRRRDGTLRAYHCPTCGGWHLGHRRRAYR